MDICAYNRDIMANLSKALCLAAVAHQDQKDRYGEAFILHPLRVMMRFSDNTERIVAVLHDIVEKTHCTYAELRGHGFSDEVISAVERLTKRKHEPYLDYIKRAAQNPLAQKVKEADLQDHLEAIQKRGLSKESQERTARFQQALHTLLQKDKN